MAWYFYTFFLSWKATQLHKSELNQCKRSRHQSAKFTNSHVDLQASQSCHLVNAIIQKGIFSFMPVLMWEKFTHKKKTRTEAASLSDSHFASWNRISNKMGSYLNLPILYWNTSYTLIKICITYIECTIAYAWALYYRASWDMNAHIISLKYSTQHPALYLIFIPKY